MSSEPSTIIAHVTTIGRKSGRPRTVELRLLSDDGKFYATSSRVRGKHWCQNLINNPSVEVGFGGKTLSCVARQIDDEALRQRILRRRGNAAELGRIVFEITPTSE